MVCIWGSAHDQGAGPQGKQRSGSLFGKASRDHICFWDRGHALVTSPLRLVPGQGLPGGDTPGDREESALLPD